MPSLAARSVLVLLLLALACAGARAQEAAAHRLPFGPERHALELVVGVAGDAALAVTVAEAPPWLAFDATRADALLPEDSAEPVARLAFRVSPTAPVGETGEIVLHVVDASGAVVAEHTVRVEADAPREVSVSPPRPNPTAGAVTVGYAVPREGRVRVSVFDALGREVLTLVDGEVAAGGRKALGGGELVGGPKRLTWLQQVETRDESGTTGLLRGP